MSNLRAFQYLKMSCSFRFLQCNTRPRERCYTALPDGEDRTGDKF